MEQGFQPGRLRQAMQRARKTATALAEALDVSDNAVSRYLLGKTLPRPDTLRLMAHELEEPVGFFLQPLPPYLELGSAPFMRSYAAATKRARLSAAALGERTREVTWYVQRWVDLPDVHFPSVNFGHDPAAISDKDIERAAIETRRAWGLGDGPIANVVRLLEHHGAVVVRTDLGDATCNAFSQWGDPEQRPYIIVSSGKGSPVGSRFDAAHELGHMVLHRHLPAPFVSVPEIHRELERQANRFAAEFLMPAESFSRSVYLTTLSALQELKEVWGTAIAAMIRRLGELELISERQEKRLWEAHSIFRRRHPSMANEPVESPMLLRESFDILRTQCGISPSQMIVDIPFAPSDTAAIVGLPVGYFREEGPRLRLKKPSEPTVLEFPQGRHYAVRPRIAFFGDVERPSRRAC